MEVLHNIKFLKKVKTQSPPPKEMEKNKQKQRKIDFQIPEILIYIQIMLSEKLISVEKYSIHLALSTSPL